MGTRKSTSSNVQSKQLYSLIRLITIVTLGCITVTNNRSHVIALVRSYVTMQLWEKEREVFKLVTVNKVSHVLHYLITGAKLLTQQPSRKKASCGRPQAVVCVVGGGATSLRFALKTGSKQTASLP